MNQNISIIIPTLNEETNIAKLILHISKHSSSENIAEIIVVDGGSTDGTLDIVAPFEKVKILRSKEGRAKQMNFGAKNAATDILYFLHADTFPPLGFDKKIIEEIGKDNVGSFRLRFEKPNHILLKLASWFTQWNHHFFRGGDQSLFITKKKFEKLHGFDEQYIIYEDIEIIKRIVERWNFTIINDYVITSEKRFNKNGVWKLYYHFLMIHIKHDLGVSPEKLHQYYLHYIR